MQQGSAAWKRKSNSWAGRFEVICIRAHWSDDALHDDAWLLILTRGLTFGTAVGVITFLMVGPASIAVSSVVVVGTLIAFRIFLVTSASGKS